MKNSALDHKKFKHTTVAPTIRVAPATPAPDAAPEKPKDSAKPKAP